ncbi:MAG TPA: zf-TFIIB domain-containing protein [Kofleriaceae bacterium]|nr:zf-TFIIB domain-containing protein [Kofleriaceae bacterium]
MADDASGPYRQGGGGPPCPRCGAPMIGDAGRSVTCVANDCGEWWARQVLEPAFDWQAVEIAEPYRVFGARMPELPCPACARDMVVSLRAKVEFAHCDAHGLWLDRRERAAFDVLGGWRVMLAARKR